MKHEAPKDLEQIAEAAAKKKYTINSFALHMDGFKDGVKWYVKYLNEQQAISAKVCQTCQRIDCKGCTNGNK